MSLPEREMPHPYVRLARKQIEAYVEEGKLLSVEDALRVCADSVIWKVRKACFVSIKTGEGQLRGCLGTILPGHPTLAEEILADRKSVV